MMQKFISIAAALTVAITSWAAAPSARSPVRVAVIGGMTLSGMWRELSVRFEKDTGWHVDTVATGPKAVLAEVFKKGGADLLTMHAGDEAADLVADGYGIHLTPWARNEHCIMGPKSDPAGIRGMADGAAALRKIQAARAPFVDFTGPGSREVSHRLWSAAGIKPQGDWVLQDQSASPQEIVKFAASKGAYVIVGRIPVLKGKIPSENMEVLVSGDPAMRRPYVVMEANPLKFPNANAEGARALSAWLTGEAGRKFLRDFALKQADGPALFHPVSGSSGEGT